MKGRCAVSGAEMRTVMGARISAPGSFSPDLIYARSEAFALRGYVSGDRR
jgi:hypothetical protein